MSWLDAGTCNCIRKASQQNMNPKDSRKRFYAHEMISGGAILKTVYINKPD